ncbi:MAG TPA: ribonuclease J [Candidatus Saccharimonadales bacterium]|nr:ribonuclease J [Candidatus Saccharimonadales bacterium]
MNPKQPNNQSRPTRPTNPGAHAAPRASRGAAIRAQKRTSEMAQKLVNEYASAETKKLKRANVIVDDFNKLKLTFLGGLDDVGEKNTAILEYENDAIIVDCGNNLGVDLPGINYEIADPTYLEAIRHKIKGYVVTHGHLDHIGGLKHIVPMFPAPIYGSRFSLGIVEKSFEDVPNGTEHYTPKLVIMNMDNHEKLKVGVFMIELIRITHSIPDATSVSIDTPVGRIIFTGDFRLDPEPLDHLPSDTNRLKQLGDEGVLLLLTESSYADSEGRTPTEHTLLQSFHDVIAKSHGRIFCAVFSSNMNRIQMIIDAAVAAGRKVAFDGRSMMSYAEIAVRQGILKVPKGTMVAMRDISNFPDEKVLVMCTGGQGEPGAALQRMSEGEHKHIKLKAGDTVVISSSPIPGNEVRYDLISNSLSKMGLHLFRHPTYELDGCGPLHVSGHARRDEMRDMLKLIRPKFVIPVHAGFLRRKYHAELAIEEGWTRDHVILANNGDSLMLTADKIEHAGQVPHGSLLVDQTGAVVSNVVVKDRLMLAEEGLVAVVLTLDKKTGQLLTSPDIITRGFIYIRDNEELMNNFRAELRRAVGQRFKRIDLDRFKAELKDHMTHFLFEQTGRSPIVIPVVNVVGGGKPNGNGNDQNSQQRAQNGQVVAPKQPSPEDLAADQQRRFQELRAKLLGQENKVQ